MSGFAECELRREMKRRSPTARLLKDVAAEVEDRRTLRRAPNNGGGDSETVHESITGRKYVPDHEWKVSLCEPGIAVGMAFDAPWLFEFLAQTIHHLDQRIEGVIQRFVRGKSPAEKLRSLVPWREVALLAHEDHTDNPGFRDSAGRFNSPFDGITATFIFGERDLIDLFCEFLHDHMAPLSEFLQRELAAGRPRLDLAEALAIAEQVVAANGFRTALDGVAGDLFEPTILQLQAWRVRAASIAARYAPKALAA